MHILRKKEMRNYYKYMNAAAPFLLLKQYNSKNDI